MSQGIIPKLFHSIVYVQEIIAFFFAFSRAAPPAYGGSQAGGLSEL